MGKVVIAVFVLAQFLDGILTYFGVKAWGLDIELNPFVRLLMSALGVGFGLIVIKLLAIGLGGILYWRGCYKSIVGLTFFYLIFAAAPWAYLFLAQ